MAEQTAYRSNALPYPVYAQAWVATFPLLDADGDPISPSSPDSEVSLNGNTFTDCTNEAVEIATSSGICYLILTAAEMTADVVTVRIQSTGAKTTVLVFHPRKLPVLSSGTCQGSNDTGDIQLASGDSAVNDYYNGCLIVAVIDGTTEARIINDYVGSTKVAEISPAWNTAQPDSDDTYTIYLPEGRQVQPVNVTYWNGTAVPSEHTAGYPIVTIKDGTGTGEINTNAGAIALVDLVTTATVDPATISGVFSTVPKANLSGIVANSGLFVSTLPDNLSGVFASVLPANLSGIVANSGLFATVLPANLSGVVANSGLFTTILKANISGVVANSGLFTTAAVDPATLSGVFATVLPANLSGVIANSGLFTTVLPANLSGVFATVLPANLSGVIANSGLFTTVLPANLSGVVANSGLFATVLPENISGVNANSGLFVTVLKATISGVVANSGLSVTTTATVASGSLYLASGSVFVNTFSSGTLNQMAVANVVVNLSGIESQIPAQSPGAAALKLTSRFNARSGATYNADGTTVFMTQSVTTASSQQPIVELGTGAKP